jgi:hypothetical protein
MNGYMIRARNLLPPRRPVGSIPNRINPKVLMLNLKSLNQFNKNISQKGKEDEQRTTKTQI